MSDATISSLIKGRWKERLCFWRDELEASAAVLNVIAHGYVLPLKSEPNPYMGKNQASAFANKSFVEECIDELLVAGCIQQVELIPHVCSPQIKKVQVLPKVHPMNLILQSHTRCN